MPTLRKLPEGEFARLAAATLAIAVASACASATKESAPAPAHPGTCSIREVAWTRAGAKDSSQVPAGRDATEAAEAGSPVRVVELTKREARGGATYWRGPLRVRDSNGKLLCERSDGTSIERVYAGEAQRVLLVVAMPAGKGMKPAARTATWISLDGCKALVPPLSGLAPAVDPGGAKVTFPPACEPGHSAQEAMCTAAQVFALDADCLPSFLSVESSALTEKEIGVAFDGTRTIRRPRSSEAEIIR